MTKLFYVLTGNAAGGIDVVTCVNRAELDGQLARLPAGLEPVLRLCEDMRGRVLVVEGRPRAVRAEQAPAYRLDYGEGSC